MNKLSLVLLISFITISSSIKAQIVSTAQGICPILVGETIPDIKLLGNYNKQISLKDKFANKPTVLIVYRGGWCPYCNAHLSDIGMVEDEIIEAGYQVIAASPDEPLQLKNTVDKKDLKYLLVSDAEGKLSQALGIAFKAPDKKWKTNQLQKYSGGKNPGFLPVPSIFIIDKKGTIVFEYVNPKYSQRMKGETLIAILKSLK